MQREKNKQGNNKRRSNIFNWETGTYGHAVLKPSRHWFQDTKLGIKVWVPSWAKIDTKNILL